MNLKWGILKKIPYRELNSNLDAMSKSGLYIRAPSNDLSNGGSELGGFSCEWDFVSLRKMHVSIEIHDR